MAGLSSLRRETRKPGNRGEIEQELGKILILTNVQSNFPMSPIFETFWFLIGCCSSNVYSFACGSLISFHLREQQNRTRNQSKPCSRPVQKPTVLGSNRNRTRSALGQSYVSFPSAWGSQEKLSGVRKRVVSKRVVLADVPEPPKPGTRVQKPVLLDPQNRNEGTRNGTTVQKAGTKAQEMERRYNKPERGHNRQNCPFLGAYGLGP